MTLIQAITAAGMTPPHRIVPGRWIRFPGIGKSRANRAGWCRLITPTLAIFGDWSSNFTATWRDEAHRDDATSKRLLEEAHRRERQLAQELRERQRKAAVEAQGLIKQCHIGTHCYLARKGFPERKELIHEKRLVIPMRDVRDYSTVLSAQFIAEDGTKKFLTGGRAKGAVFRIGSPKADRIVLCEGFATGLSIDAALKRLSAQHAVVVCFSAGNIEIVAHEFPRAVIAADNDRSATGEETAKRTGLKWTMPYEVGTDWNDVHVNLGLHVVVERMRELLQS